MTPIRPTRELGSVAPEEYSLAMSHPFFLLSKYGFINDPNRPNLGTFKWELWPWQVELLMKFAAQEELGEGSGEYVPLYPRIATLKSRQLGVSWLVAGYAMWLFLAKPGARILGVSKGQKEAKDLLKKATSLYRDLPPEFHFPSNMKDADSTDRFYSEVLGSEFISLPDAPGVGRSYTATLVILDEWAFQDYAADIYGGIEPTLGLYGQLIGISTANGPSGIFYSVYFAAVRGENSFLPIFLDYSLRPGRDEAWRDEQDRKFRAAGTPEKTASEYPRSWLEAFQSSLASFFPLDLISSLIASIRAPLEAREEPGGKGALHVYKRPVSYRKYAIGADTAQGVTRGNYSTAWVLDAITGECMAVFRANLPPEQFAVKLDSLGREYNKALLAVEANFSALPLFVLQRHLHYPNLFHRLNEKGDKFEESPGWLTTRSSKPDMLLRLRSALLDGDLTSPDRWFADEAQYFAENRLPSGHVEYNAALGHTDDVIIAAAIANAVRKFARGMWRAVRRTGALSR